MNIFKQITTYFTKPSAQSPKSQAPLMSSNSFEIITEDIIESCLREEFLLLDDNQQSEGLAEQEEIQNMYVKDFFLIGKKCQGSVLSLELWKEIIKQSDLSIVSKKDLYFSIFQGIDYRIRKDVWQVLANAFEMKKKTKLTYLQLTDPAKLPKSELQAIDKDVCRTSGLTSSLKQLRQILIAYANLSETNYTQGMNIIGGVLLRLLQIQNDKGLEGHLVVEGQLSERVFWVLVGVMKCKNWQEVFQKDLSGLHRMLGVMRGLMLEYVPSVMHRIEALEWDLGIFAQYYVTICLSHCPPDLAPIILDLFLLDGENVVHSLLIRMLVVNQQKILAFKDECLLMKYLKSQMLLDTYQRLLKDRAKAEKLQDFQINFLRTTP